ncbi:MAG TPA: lipoyl(octanoyl) transferase LipB [Rhizomicrobium sp.]|nr:lipoyl(octanoyl) transferase LipB [Rhizomicrobium sp.]
MDETKEVGKTTSFLPQGGGGGPHGSARSAAGGQAPGRRGTCLPPDVPLRLAALGTSPTLGEEKRASSLRSSPVEWRVEEGLVAYPRAVEFMENRVARIADGLAPELIWLIEHPPIYTAGTSAKPSDLLDCRFPVFQTGRGGQFTYHGPRQRVAYVMLDLRLRKADVRAFVRNLEEWIIRTLARFGIAGERRDGRVGIWVVRGNGSEDKIAAIGVRVRRWVTFHGVALNVSPNLDDFGGIVPCGVRGHGVTSLADLGIGASMAGVDAALRAEFENAFGRLHPSTGSG